MKILQINSVCGIRSTGRIATDIAESYILEGHECRIAYGREIVPEKYKDLSYRIGNETAVKFNGLKARIFDTEGFNAKNETIVFLKWAEEYNPDLLWLHNLHGYYINVKMLFDWIKSRPQMEVRWTLHDCWAFTGHCSHFAYVKCDKWKNECVRCLQTHEYPRSILLDNSKNNYYWKRETFCGVKNMTIVTPSYWLANLVKQSFLKEYRIEVIHNKIDNISFKPTMSDFRNRYGLDNKKIILGVASAWCEKKGLGDFIRLSEMLSESYQIVLVGITEKQKKKIPKKILCLPRTNSKTELAEIYTAADIFLNLTYEDTYPTVNLEAQACGTPCITYQTGGSVESVPWENTVEQGVLADVIKKIDEICL